MTQSFNFVITHKDDPTEELKYLIISAETKEFADGFANQKLEEYKNNLLLEPEEFEQISFSIAQTDDQIDFYFTISHKDDQIMALKHLIIHSDSQEIATNFASEEFEEYKNSLLIKTKNYPENFLTNKDKNMIGFAFFPMHFDLAYKDLADMAEAEDWEYHSTSAEYERPVLVNYIKYTYKRLAQENKIAISKNGRFSCFNTGLITNNQEPIYATFEANRSKDFEPWIFRNWLRHGDRKLTVFPELPDIANYINDTAYLFFDAKKDLKINMEHIINDTRDRFPEPYKSQNDYTLQATIRGSIDNTKERVRRSYKTAIPCYYQGKIQLLLPLCLKDSKHADLALAVENYDNFYRATTCLTLSMAYCDARLIAKPDREWLIP